MTVQAALSSISAADLQNCCNALKIFNAGSCLCDSSLTGLLSSSTGVNTSTLTTAVLPLVSTACGGLPLRVTQNDGSCSASVVASKPAPVPSARPVVMVMARTPSASAAPAPSKMMAPAPAPAHAVNAASGPGTHAGFTTTSTEVVVLLGALAQLAPALQHVAGLTLPAQAAPPPAQQSSPGVRWTCASTYALAALLLFAAGAAL